MNTALFWHEYDHDGELEIRSEYSWPDQAWAIIYPGTRFAVRVFT